MGRKYETYEPDSEGWTPWIKPDASRYRLACCDCGLVHDMQFAITTDDSVGFRVRRNNRSTAMMRRNKEPNWGKTFVLFAKNSLVALFMMKPRFSKREREKFIRDLAERLELNVRFE